ncbi:hypothetical protein, variant [Exophiala xenobiotica]|uniref:Beta-lactamase-related domain-containing protein n=1 Tax=Exophiala xenobiotica TaxID=348802 RepID=A0A0D2E6D5_9EURO|nr:hypothetical protein, variant [Exophiala xenobiotica]XP_013310904.1 uncharacterized protein PV05_11917 [Exophiala xenobiotica]KIW50319.1 hypothetical protein PV05_11917 [Exophiala xenobiotica]KIW50320.1 hypothetical protein, variant [Exophiala xenobiotica]
MAVQGHCNPRFASLKSELESQLKSGNELGASIVVNIDGENVVDIWGGHADSAHTLPWDRDTIANVWSSTKTITTLAALIQISRGHLDPDAPVSKYWPEFAQNGKDKVLVRHFLSHTSGVSGWEGPITWPEIYDPVTSVERLAAQAPWWEPGTASGYHAVNMGHLIGELIKRTSGKTLKQFVSDEIATPLGADFQIGAAEQDWPRVASLVPPPPAAFDFSKLDPNSPTVKTFANPVMDATNAHTPEWRRADLGAVNGHGNARSLVRILSTAVTLGKVDSDGVRLLSPETIDRIFKVQADGTDVVIGIPVCFGTGYGLTSGGTATSVPWLPQGKVCFWPGWGGSIVIMDLERKITFAYVMNKMGPGILGSDRTEAYVKAAYKALGLDGY